MASRSIAHFGSKTAIRFLRIQSAKCLASGVSGNPFFKPFVAISKHS
jgi:hypothetical protein